MDWPPLLAALADHLEIERFRFSRFPAARPTPMRAAWMMPERVEEIAVVSGAPPIAELNDRSGLLRFYAGMLALREPAGVVAHLFSLARPLRR